MMEAPAQIKRFREYIERGFSDFLDKQPSGCKKSVTRVTRGKIIDSERWIEEKFEAKSASDSDVTRVTSVLFDDFQNYIIENNPSVTSTVSSTIKKAVTDVTHVTHVTRVTDVTGIQNKHIMALACWHSPKTYSQLIDETEINFESLRQTVHRSNEFFDQTSQEPIRIKASELGKKETKAILLNHIEKIEQKIKSKLKILLEEEEKKKIRTAKDLMAKLEENARKKLGYLDIDFADFAQFDPILAEDLLNNPAETIEAFEIAISELDLSNLDNLFQLRFFNLPKCNRFNIGDLRRDSLQKLISIKGIIAACSDVRPQVTSARFECPSCGNKINVIQTSSKFAEPTRCGCGRKGKFRLLSKDLINGQGIVLEELQEDIGLRAPARINILLKNSLTEPTEQQFYASGRPIIVNGILEEVPIVLRSGGLSTKFDIMLEAISCEKGLDVDDIELSDNDIRQIKEKLASPKIIEHLKSDLFPSIEGYPLVKEAILHQMVSGTNDKIQRPREIHILVVGVPGIAKTHMGKKVIELVPGAQYVGINTSYAGLVGGVVKDQFLQGFATERGAATRANGSVLVCDELDKWAVHHPENLLALNEPLSEGTATNTKILKSSLPARVACLALCNPKNQEITNEPLKSLIEFIPLSLLDRFDLVFVLQDESKEDQDKKIFSKILNSEKDSDIHFKRKLLYYCRHKIHPIWSKEAEAKAQDFYVKARASNKGHSQGSKRLSPRFAMTLIKFSEARAKLQGHQRVSVDDVIGAFQLVKDSISAIGGFRFDNEEESP